MRENLTIISPANDGESKTIVEICKRLGVDVRISKQPWGAALDREPAENLTNLKETVVIVEMPSPSMEENLRKSGRTVRIVDHHFYPTLNLDRRNKLSSLEQIAHILEYQLTRKELGIAINDRSYIFGLVDAGFTRKEIIEIREFDLEAQGVSASDRERVREELKKSPVKNGITILHLDFDASGYAQDFLVLEDPAKVPDLLVLTGHPVRTAQFYGDPNKVDQLLEIGEWTGGSGKSKFWGTNHPDLPEIYKRLKIE
jgi:hypothetical protein